MTTAGYFWMYECNDECIPREISTAHAALLEDSPCQPLVLQASLQLGGHGWKLFDLGLVEHVGLFLESLFAFLGLLGLLPLLLLLLADLIFKLFAGCLLLYLHTHTHTTPSEGVIQESLGGGVRQTHTHNLHAPPPPTTT